MVMDTHPKMRQLELMRQAPSRRKVHPLGEMCLAMEQLAYSGLRQRHPTAAESDTPPSDRLAAWPQA